MQMQTTREVKHRGSKTEQNQPQKQSVKIKLKRTPKRTQILTHNDFRFSNNALDQLVFTAKTDRHLHFYSTDHHFVISC